MIRLWRWLRWWLVDSAGNLLAAPILAEITIHVMPDFSRRVYVSKLDVSPAILAKIIESVVRTGMDIGNQHNITVQFAPPLPPASNHKEEHDAPTAP